MNPIDTLFQTLRATNRKAFMPFLTAGDPDLAFTQEALTAMAASGASLIEIGFPFSDPIADGPVIQASYTRALNAKIKLADIFAMLKATTSQPGWNTPLVAMVSYTLIYKLGAAKFIATAQASGISGAVVPDMPVEEAEELAKLAAAANFGFILLVTPTTTPKRMETIVKACRGFVYVVSIVGITGERNQLPSAVKDMVARLRTLTDLPLCVGFGVSKPEHVRELRDLVDGVIVGTALVRKLEAANTPAGRLATLEALRTTCASLSAALIIDVTHN